MQSFGAFLVSLIVAGAGVASAMPATSAKPTGLTSSVEVIYNKDFKPNLATSLVKAYKKHNIPIPPNVQAAADRHLQKRQTGTAPASPVGDDFEYLVPVQIGTPAQTLHLDFDSGSSDLWVFSSETPKSEVNGQSIYTPSKSSTSSKYSGETWQIQYADGSGASGDIYYDKVTVGGLAVSKQAVESATKVSSSFTSDASDGLLGLAFDSINTASPRQVKTWFTNIQSSLSQPLWTANLNHEANGSYNFGYIDSSSYTGSLTYASIDSSEGFWTFTSSGYAVGSGTFKKSSISGIADTGTTLLLLQDSVVDAYYNQVPGASYDDNEGGYVFPCSTTLPNFTFGVGSARIVVPGRYINFESDGGTCFGGLQSGGDQNIFGDVALKSAFVVFDKGQSRIGWANKKTT